MLNFILSNKPLLVGLHLGFAILGIDALLWVAGELIANPASRIRLKIAAWTALAAFSLSWLIGGYYYVHYYGSIVKPVILASTAPWAHEIAMEAKEHIFLFLVPIACLIACTAMLKREEFNELKIKNSLLVLVVTSAAIALFLGLMGYIISAAARWA